MQDLEQVRELYLRWIKGWNEQSADLMAETLLEDAFVIGFDGSQMNGRDEVRSTLAGIFSQYPTGIFVTLIREVCLVSPGVALLRANVGMVPRGFSEINPAVNALQSLVAISVQGTWKIRLFQNTPAAFHGSPELIQKLTDELATEFKKTQY